MQSNNNLNVSKDLNKEITIFNNNKTNIRVIPLENGSNDSLDSRHYAPASQEWINSIYSYNKNITKYLPIKDKILFNIIKSYFNLYNKKQQRKANISNIRIRFKRLSILKMFVSKAEIKHTSSKAIITLYVYNRQKKYLINKLNNMKIFKEFNNRVKHIENQSLNILKLIHSKSKLLSSPPILTKTHLFKYADMRYNILIRKALVKEISALYIKQLLHFNRSKFEDTYLLQLGNIVKKLYNKDVEFNIVNLKYIHLNSDIFTQSIALKLRRNKNNLVRVLKIFMDMIKLKKISYYASVPSRLTVIQLWKRKLSNNLSYYLDDNKDNLNKLLTKIFRLKNPKLKTKKSLENLVLNSIKYKNTLGIKLEAQGRLSKRLTASKSVFKFKYKGSLKNIDSSYKGLSTVILRGNLKSNVQFSKISSKTRNGSFGVKGWLSGS